MVRMFPLNVLVPIKAMLDLRLPPSGRPEQARSSMSHPSHSTYHTASTPLHASLLIARSDRCQHIAREMADRCGAIVKTVLLSAAFGSQPCTRLDSQEHRPFGAPSDFVILASMQDNVTMMASLQAPKRVRQCIV